MTRGGAIYIMSNKTNTTLYIGVTSDLRSRVFEHKSKLYPLVSQQSTTLTNSFILKFSVQLKKLFQKKNTSKGRKEILRMR